MLSRPTPHSQGEQIVPGLQQNMQSITELLDVQETELVTAGFPCIDVSRAGLKRGMGGQATSVVRHVFRLLERALRDNRGVPWVLLENVRWARSHLSYIGFHFQRSARRADTRVDMGLFPCLTWCAALIRTISLSLQLTFHAANTRPMQCMASISKGGAISASCLHFVWAHRLKDSWIEQLAVVHQWYSTLWSSLRGLATRAGLSASSALQVTCSPSS